MCVCVCAYGHISYSMCVRSVNFTNGSRSVKTGPPFDLCVSPFLSRSLSLAQLLNRIDSCVDANVLRDLLTLTELH